MKPEKLMPFVVPVFIVVLLVLACQPYEKVEPAPADFRQLPTFQKLDEKVWFFGIERTQEEWYCSVRIDFGGSETGKRFYATAGTVEGAIERVWRDVEAFEKGRAP